MNPSSSTTSSDRGFFSRIFGESLTSVTPTSEDSLRSTRELTARSTEATVATSVEHTSIQTKVREGFTPLNGQPQIFTREQRMEFLRMVEGEQITLKTHDGILLDAVWSPSKDGARNSPTVIFFHGNGCTLDSMRDYAKWYHDRGVNTLFLTTRGYPGIEENPAKGDAVKQGELGFYYDVEAAVRYALIDQKVPRDRLFSHGYSLGGAMTAALGYFFDRPATLDHTFTSAAAVMGNIGGSIPDSIVRGMARGTYPKGETDTIVNRLPDSIQLKTDALDSLAKIRAMRQPFFVMYGTHDHIMPMSFADDFYAGRYGLPPSETKPVERRAYMEQRNALMAEIPGGHWGPFMDNEEAVRKYETYLVANGLMERKYLSH